MKKIAKTLFVVIAVCLINACADNTIDELQIEDQASIEGSSDSIVDGGDGGETTNPS